MSFTNWSYQPYFHVPHACMNLWGMHEMSPYSNSKSIEIKCHQCAAQLVCLIRSCMSHYIQDWSLWLRPEFTLWYTYPSDLHRWYNMHFPESTQVWHDNAPGQMPPYSSVQTWQIWISVPLKIAFRNRHPRQCISKSHEQRCDILDSEASVKDLICSKEFSTTPGSVPWTLGILNMYSMTITKPHALVY